MSAAIVIQYAMCMRVLYKYSHLPPVWLYQIFPYYLINGTTFRKKLLNIKCLF